MTDHAQTYRSNAIKIGEQDIYAFARQFDPQPYHLDRAEGDASIFGGLCASGWHIAALANRLIAEALLGAGLPFVDITAVRDMRWKKPSFADDTIAVTVALGVRIGDSCLSGCHTTSATVEVRDSDENLVAEIDCELAMESHNE